LRGAVDTAVGAESQFILKGNSAVRGTSESVHDTIPARISYFEEDPAARDSKQEEVSIRGRSGRFRVSKRVLRSSLRAHHFLFPAD